MNRRKSIGISISLIIIGLVFLFSNFIEGFNWHSLWPIFLIIPIIFLTIDFINAPDLRKSYIFPIVFLTQLMVFFLIWNIFLNYEYMNKLWPFFIIMPGISLLVLSLFNKDFKKMISSIFLICLGFVFCIFTFNYYSYDILYKIWPVFLIFAGIVVFINQAKIKK